MKIKENFQTQIVEIILSQLADGLLTIDWVPKLLTCYILTRVSSNLFTVNSKLSILPFLLFCPPKVYDKVLCIYFR